MSARTLAPALLLATACAASSAPAPAVQTIVVGADGRVRKVYRKVDVSKHAQEILDDVKARP